MSFRLAPLCDKSRQPRVTSKIPLASPVPKLSGNPTKDKSPLKIEPTKVKIFRLKSTSINMLKMTMYPPTIKIDTIESYIVLDRISCVLTFGLGGGRTVSSL